MEAVSRHWSNTEARNYPQGRARFVLELLPMVARAEDMGRAAGQAEEIIQKNVGRTLERMASYCAIESGIIGLEYARYRARVLGGAS